MFALRRRYVREADEGAASSASLPEIPEKRSIRVLDNDEIDESSASLPENGIKSRQQAICDYPRILSAIQGFLSGLIYECKDYPSYTR